MGSIWILAGLAVLASVSPLLTYAKLYQLKEWRWDRFSEHLRMTGWHKTFLGGTKQTLTVLALASCLLLRSVAPWIAMAILTALFLMGIAQAARRSQPLPVWTMKAKAVVAASLLLTAGLGWLGTLLPDPARTAVWALIVVLLQPLVVAAALLAFTPVDRFLKLRVMGKAAALRIADPARAAVGIVGSVGKTTTKELIRHVLRDLSPLVTPEHVNTEMGVAQWLLRELKSAPPGAPLIVEMGAYRRHEVETLCRIVRPTAAVVTALGSDHLALFGSEADIVAANGEILAALPDGAPAFCAVDTDGGRMLISQTSRPLTTVGVTPDAALRAEDVRDTPDGLRLRTGQLEILVPLRGRHHAVNVLLAVAVARHLGVTDARIKELLATFCPLKNTFNVRTERDVLLVDDTYNASRLSLLAALDWAGEQEARPRTLLTAGLLELGADEDRIMEEAGRHAAGKVERVVFTAESGRKAFEKGFGSSVETLSSSTASVRSGSMLLCVGRMPRSSIETLLP